MINLLINLKTSQDRLQEISETLTKLNINFERVEAIDGRLLSESTKRRLTYPLDHFDSKVKFTRELTPGEIGCFLSHRECWKKLLASREKFALVMEDDIKISSIACGYMTNSNWIPSDVSICQLSCLNAIQKGRIDPHWLPIDQNIKLVSPIYPIPLGAQCYIISRDAACKAIELSEKFPCPVDDFLFSPWFDIVKYFKVWRTAPTLVVPTNNTLSTIGDRSKKQSKKAPFFIRHSLTRMRMNMNIKKGLKKGIPFTFAFGE